MRTIISKRELIHYAYHKQYRTMKGIMKIKPKVYILKNTIVVSTKNYDAKLKELS